MNKLTELGIKHNSDKATYHLFTDVYEPHFSRFENPTILEMGVYNGGSIRMMDEYFGGYCNILGFDRGDQLMYTPQKNNINLLLGDQSIESDLFKCLEFHKEYDIIIDDASHFVDHQIFSFNVLFPYLKSGGIYIIEDLHTSLHDHYNPNKNITALDWLTRLKNCDQTLDKDLLKYVDDINSIDILCTRQESEKITHLDSITSIIIKK